MLFKRRTPHSFSRKIREFIWPSMGWGRVFHYIRHRIARLSDSKNKIALGLALGTGLSFTPLVGTHLLQAAALAWILRANIWAALIGTFVGNPWTFPFMWLAAIELGAFIFSLMGLNAETNIPPHIDMELLWTFITHEPWRLFLPWLVGGYLLCIVSLPFSYGIFYLLVRWARRAQRRARVHRMHQVGKEITGQKK